jgi:glyoxylase I family protein
MIELMPTKDAGPKPETVARFAPGIRHIALRVRNFDAAYTDLKMSGIKFLGEPGDAVGGGRIVSFRDPEGNELQIVER